MTSPSCQREYALDPPYVGSDALRTAVPRSTAIPILHNRAPHHVRQTRRVICIKMESNTVRPRCLAQHPARYRAFSTILTRSGTYAEYLMRDAPYNRDRLSRNRESRRENDGEVSRGRPRAKGTPTVACRRGLTQLCPHDCFFTRDRGAMGAILDP